MQLEAERDFAAREARARYGHDLEDWEQGGRDASARSPDRRRASPSPDQRRGHHGRLSSPRIVRTIKDSSAGGGWHMLTKTNYIEWSMVMKVKMPARHMWDAVRYGDADFAEDRLVLEALLAAIPPEMAPTFANKETAKDACDAIVDARISRNHARRATL